jgi:hypothetical protein
LFFFSYQPAAFSGWLSAFSFWAIHISNALSGEVTRYHPLRGPKKTPDCILFFFTTAVDSLCNIERVFRPVNWKNLRRMKGVILLTLHETA